MIKLILPGSIRSKKNSKTATMVGGVKKPRRAIIIPSKAYTAWEKAARWAIQGQVRGLYSDRKWLTVPTDAPVEVKATVYYKGQRPDLSGCLESVGDCLEGIVWENDKQIVSWDGSRLHKDNANPRTVVEVR